MSRLTRKQALELKTMDQLDRDDVVFMHLDRSHYHATADLIFTSTLDSVESEMRQSRGLRILSTYTPLLCAFAILDQLGSAYSDATKAAPPREKSGIIKALQTFGAYAIGSPESDALYSLRNGLVHDASFTHRWTTKTRDEWRIFRINNKQAEAVRNPVRAWDGQHTNLTRDVITWINVRQLTEEVSDIITAVRDLHETRVSDLIVNLSRDEILHRYMLWGPRASESDD